MREKPQAIVHDAWLCLLELDLHPFLPLQPMDISRRRNLPINRCLQAIHRLSLAGVTRAEPGGEVVLVRPLSDVAPEEILDAVWTSFKVKPAVQMLIQTRDAQPASAVAAALDLEIALG